MREINAIELLRCLPAGVEGTPRGHCDACGTFIWSDGGYRVPGLKGIFCSLFCIECAIAERAGQTKTIPGVPVGNGARLLAYLKTASPELYRRILGEKAHGHFCRNPKCPNGENGMPATLDHLRAGTLFCSSACKMQAGRTRLTTTFDPLQNRYSSQVSSNVFVE
jgi:hypothetical protein